MQPSLKLLGSGVSGSVYSLQNAHHSSIKHKSKICVKVAHGGSDSKDRWWNYAYWIKFVNKERHYSIPKIYFLDTVGKLAVMEQYEMTLHHALVLIRDNETNDSLYPLAKKMFNKYFTCKEPFNQFLYEELKEFLKEVFDHIDALIYDHQLYQLSRMSMGVTEEFNKFMKFFMEYFLPAATQFKFFVSDLHARNVMINKFGELVIIDPSY